MRRNQLEGDWCDKSRNEWWFFYLRAKMSVKKDRLKRVTDKKDKRKRMRCGYEVAGMRFGNGRGEKAIRIPGPGSKMSNNEVWNIGLETPKKNNSSEKKINK